MLDLSKSQQRIYKIKWKDGEVIKLKLPTRALLVSIMDLRDREDRNELELLDDVCALLAQAFNRNENQRTFTNKDFEDFPMNVLFEILVDYMNYGFTSMGESVSPAYPVGQGKMKNPIS